MEFSGQNVFVAILSRWTKLLPCLKVWILDKCRKIFIQFSWVCKQWSIKKKGITLHMSKVKFSSTLSKFEISSNLHQHLSMKVVCFVLFCFVGMRSSEPGCFRSCSWCLWKAVDEEGYMGLVPWHLDLWCKSFGILNIFSLKIKIKS